MITRYPILEFLSRSTGAYKSCDGTFELELRKNGYDFLLLTNNSTKRSQIYGVIGVLSRNLELHASVGLPHITVFTWPHALAETGEKVEINFKEADVGLEILMAFEAHSLVFSLSLGEQEKSRFVLQKV